MAYKQKLNITLFPDTIDRLKQAAQENHTSVSGLIEYWAWHGLKVKQQEGQGGRK